MNGTQFFRAVRTGAVVMLAAACSESATGPRPGATGPAQQSLSSAAVPQLVITEFMADPSRVADAAGEWFEVFNAGPTAIDLQGWRISSGTSESHVIAASVLVPAGGFAVLGNNANEATNGGAPVAYSYGSAIILNNSNTDWLRLQQPDLTTVDSVAYSARDATGAIVSPTYTPSAGVSRVLLDIASDSAVAATGAWQNTPVGVTYGLGDRGTPGTGPYGGVGPVVTVVVSPATANVVTGATQSFTAIGFDASEQPSPTTFVWSSSDASVATIDAATGVATGVAAGQVTITAQSANGVSGTAQLTVTAPPVGVPNVIITEFLSDPAAVADGSGEWFEVFNADDVAVELQGWQIRSGPTGSETHVIASSVIVPAHGFAVIGNNANSATNGGVTIAYAYGSSIALNNSNTDWITLKLPDGTLVDSVAYSARNPDGSIGSPSYSPLAGRARVLLDAAHDNTIAASASWQDATQVFGAGDRGTPGTGSYVPVGPVANVVVAPSAVTLSAGATQSFTAAGFDSNGQPSPTTFSWSSDNPAVITVDAATGLATAVAEGSAGITATSANNVSGTAAVTVTAPPPPASGLVITEFLSDPSGSDGLGEWIELFNAGSTAIDLQGWQLGSNSSTGVEAHVIAPSLIVPAGGFIVLGNNTDSGTNGGANVAYSYGTDITLNNSNTDWITLKRPDGTLEDSVSYSTRDASGAITAPQFTPVANTAREVIDVDIDNAIAASGNWRSATRPFGTGANTGTPGFGAYGTPGPVATIIVSPAIGAAAIGGTRAFSALAIDALGRIADPTFTWLSSDVAIATIDATGLATGVAIGSVTITASADGVDGTALLNVTDPNAPATIAVNINAPARVPVGYTKPAFVTVRRADNSVIAPTPPLTWSSSDPSVATVDDRGYIDGLAIGTTEIRATAANGVFGVATFSVVAADAPTTAVYRNHLEFGTPTDADPTDDIVQSRREFAFSYSALRGAPNWVGWNINGTQFGPVPRCDCFSSDHSLPLHVYRVHDSDYRNSGYDRGHMVQSESRTVTEQENAATFLLTNILPQAGENNQGPWGQFENYLNDLARTQNREIYVIAGGEYAATPMTLKDEGRVAIPDYTWKVAVIVPAGTGLAEIGWLSSLEVIAVRMPNLLVAGVPASALGIRNTPWQTFLTTVDAIEAAVGYDLLDALPDLLEQIVESGDRPPVAAIVGGPFNTVEGASITLTGSATDPDAGDVLTFSWQLGDGNSATGTAPTHTYADNGTYDVRLIVTDSFGAADTVFTTVQVTNAAPTVTSLSTPGAALAVGAAASVHVTYADAGSADTHQVAIDWGDGTSTTLAGSAGVASSSHAYASPGFYSVRVTVTDDDGAAVQQTASAPVIVFGAGGTLSGEGWTDSPAGAYTFDPAVTGRANLSVNPKYLPGGQLSGEFEFRVNGADARFNATALDWLVVTGNVAVLQGAGRFRNRSGTFSFTLTVIDGDGAGGGGPDAARLRIVDAAGAVVYDNLPGADAAAAAPLRSGNLTVR